MSTFGIDGLSSGLDTTAIVNQLMQLERQPAVRLEGRTAQNKLAITALGTLKTSLASVSAAAKALQDPTKNFMPRLATSSASHVTATASATADVGSMSFSVDRLSARHTVVSEQAAANRDVVINATGGDVTINLTVGATSHDITVADGTTLRQLADQINTVDGLGVQASLVDTGSGIKLQLASTTAGAAGAFTTDLSALDATALGGSTTMNLLSQGQDALLTVGKGSAGEYTITSATNTFTDLIAGLSFTATAAKPDETVTVGVESDPAALTEKVKTFVNAVNSALTEMDKQLRNSLNGATPGALSGNSAIRTLRDQLINAVTYPVAGTELGTGALAGIKTTRTGSLEFDAATLTAALTADPDAVAALFRSDDPNVPGIADRVLAHAEEATKANTGVLATVVKSRESENRTFADQIERIDRRVALRRQTMMRQFANLEVVMGNMQAQQSWLSSQIGSLNANAG